MEIREVNYGIANNFGDYIEINKELKKFPKLYKSILAHELKHTKKPFSFIDLGIDLKENNIPTFQLLKFMSSRPKTWIQFLPFYIKDKKLIYDFNLIVVYLFGISLEFALIKFFFF